MLISSTDFRLNMLISVDLIKKKHVTIVQFLYTLYDSKKKKRTQSHIFWRKYLSLQRNQVFWRVLSQGDIIECISFFVDKLDVVDVKNACPQFSTFCHSSDNLKKKNTWFLQAYKFCFADFSKTSNNFRNRGHVFSRYIKHYSSTES